MLQINDLTYRVAGRTLLADATAAVDRGQRVGLVGPNGSGKTTLLRLILGEVAPDSGTISMPPRWRVGTVAQTAPDGEASLLDVVLAADAERAHLLEVAETTGDPHRIAEAHVRLADIDGYAAPARAAQILSGLGFDETAQSRAVGELSGGMRMRVALAAALFAAPDLLLLDEPTNHLDLEATLWLESFVRSYPHTVVIVSHDRSLLNRAVERIVAVEQNRLVSYTGNYDSYEAQKRARMEQIAKLQTKQLAQRRHMQAFVDRFRYKASKARQAQSRIKALARMEPIASVTEDRTIAFDFPQPDPMSPPLITLDDVSVGYDGTPVLKGLGLSIDMDDRIALLGANGNGKSTLARLLADRLKPLTGRLRKSPKLRVGYFAQHQQEELRLGRSVLADAQAWMPMATEQKLRTHLGAFGFTQARVETKIGALSGGEKARLLFALMAREAPHVLILDEPTNHLDVDSREALVHALNAYEGAVILITHDPHLIELTADRLWLVADGGCRAFDGDMEDYRRLLLDQRRGGNGGRAGTAGDGERRSRRKAAADARAQIAPLRRRIEAAEKHLAALGKKKREIEARLADPALYDGPPERITTLQRLLHEIEAQTARAEEQWLEACHALERAEETAA